MRLTGKLQKDLARAMGVTRPAVTLMLNGGSEIRLKKMYLAARELGVTISDLTDDTYYRQDEDFLSRFEANNKKATGDTPMASGELLRLGLNQRPSD
nr:helix-turn-helix transcriptional regulator [Bifidobacterium longum]